MLILIIKKKVPHVKGDVDVELDVDVKAPTVKGDVDDKGIPMPKFRFRAPNPKVTLRMLI